MASLITREEMRKERGATSLKYRCNIRIQLPTGYLVNAGTFISGPKSLLTSGYAGMIVAY